MDHRLTCKRQHVKDNTVKVLEENSREYLHGTEVDKDFLGRIQKH